MRPKACEGVLLRVVERGSKLTDSPSTTLILRYSLIKFLVWKSIHKLLALSFTVYNAAERSGQVSMTRCAE